MARGINKVILIGNLGADPEVRYMPNGNAVANFTLATSESWTDKQTNEKKELTEWHRIVVYQRLAEIAGEYLRKGSKVYVEGRLRTRKWQDQQGVERYTTEILVNELQMLDGLPAQGGQQNAAPAQQQQQRPAAQQQRTGYAANGSALPNNHTGAGPHGGFNQSQGGGQRGPLEPPIDFDQDIPF